MSGRYNFRRSTRSQQVPHQPPEGSPSDPTRRIKLNVHDLDLDKSYVGIVIPPKRPDLPKKHRPWSKWTGANPLTDLAKLPPGWHMNEDDLEKDDIDAQIERCHERIAENILPHVFQQKLEEYMAVKVKRDAIRFTGSEKLSWETIQRVHELESMKADITRDGDKVEQLPNIDALLKVYKSGELAWYTHTGLVTYWSRGAQICQPRPFDWDEFEAINSALTGDKGFWTEGLTGPESDTSYAGIISYPDPNRPKLNALKLALRAPGIQFFAELDYLHDTGAGMMTLYEGDLKTLLGPFGAAAGPTIPIVGSVRSRVGNGAFITRDVIQMEVTILDGARQRMTAWTRTMCALNKGNWACNDVPRLDGPILRDLLYLGSPPDGGHPLHIATTRSGLNLPDLDLAANPPGHLVRYRGLTLLPAPILFAGHGGWLAGAPAKMAMPPPAAGAP